MAPEILERAGYDARADIWSTGCTFAEILTGTLLFGNVYYGIIVRFI